MKHIFIPSSDDIRSCANDGSKFVEKCISIIEKGSSILPFDKVVFKMNFRGANLEIGLSHLGEDIYQFSLTETTGGTIARCSGNLAIFTNDEFPDKIKTPDDIFRFSTDLSGNREISRMVGNTMIHASLQDLESPTMGGVKITRMTFDKIADDNYALIERFIEAFTSHLVLAMVYFVRFFTDSKYFVVHEVSARKRAGKIVTKPNDPGIYRILHITDIRKKYIKRNGSSGETSVGYERRGHMRTFRDERYVNMRGKSIFIKSTWVGPQESLVGDKLYKVYINTHN